MFLRKIILSIYIGIGSSALFAQIPNTPKIIDTLTIKEYKSDSIYKALMKFELDSVQKEVDSLFAQVYTTRIPLKQVLVLGKLKFKSYTERRRYLILRRKTRKVWPYATMAASRLMELNRRLDRIEDRSDRKDYIKMVQNYLNNRYKEKLKNLTMTEGQILVKLLYRQTGVTAYDLVRDFKSGWSAFWYNAAAGLYDISLKEKYSPLEVEEDYLIENILKRSFQKNILEPQDPAIELDFIKAINKWDK